MNNRGWFEHNGKIFHASILWDRDKPRGKDKFLLLFDEELPELKICFNGFDKDFKTHESLMCLLDNNIKEIEEWLLSDRTPAEWVVFGNNS